MFRKIGHFFGMMFAVGWLGGGAPFYVFWFTVGLLVGLCF
jgi:hypothetical protein